ncbi:hypothetical protein POF45_29370 [Pseudomonas sp. 681]|uniref:Uncharacterized protein n=1 Tax=Pseudomonas fungipugnans TaxID=3024217 RepID=A0ABT6QX71_9PSED|nr:hypothetical protein [Pseudomonas sp. 681]MDI2595503.1 hypothetical protein [Pseudomonas sp. 681]
MAIIDSQRRSAEARGAYRKLRNKAHAAAIADPIPTATIDAIIGPGGLLNGPVIKVGGMKVNIPIWADTGEYDGDYQVLTLFIAPGHVDDPLDPAFVRVGTPYRLDYPFDVGWVGDYTVPLSNIFPDGSYTFRHEVELHTGQTVYSATVKVISDITAPYELTTPPEPKAMVFVTAEVDSTNIDRVTGLIPAYTDQAPGDQYLYWYASDPLPEDPSTLDPVAPLTDVPTARNVIIPSAYIAARGDGVFYVLYALIDAARNRSNLSGWARFVVTLGALPNNLKKPEVPVGAGGVVIDRDTAVEGVVVHIKPYTGWKSGDKINANWGGFPLPDGFPSQSADTEIVVPAQTLLGSYRGATGEKTITVSYVVDRLGRQWGPEEDDFTIDFSVVGPDRPDPDPDFPDPTNPLLLAGTVKGSNSVNDNVLVEADAGDPVTFTFKIYDPVNAGETIEFFWEGTHVTEADFTITDEDAGDIETVEFPWSYIAATDNGPGKKVYYTIGDPSVTPNRQRSLVTDVNVDDAIVLKPDAPTFVGLSDRGWLICDSLQPPDSAVVVKVPDLSQWLNPNDTVKMSWELFQPRVGNTPVPGTLFAPELTLGGPSDPYPVTGFEWRVEPYADYILPSYNPPLHTEGNAKVTYSFTLNGKRVTSEQLAAPVSMSLSDISCIIPPIP